MDNLRNFETSLSNSQHDGSDYASYEDDAAIDAPMIIGGDERRMHVRAYNFWAGLLGDNSFPAIEDLEAENEDFGSHSVLLDFTSGIENPAIQYLGDSIREECGLDDDIAYINQVPSRSLLSRITDHYMQIIANQAPIGFEAEFVNQRGSTIMYRGILLPFSSDNDTIDFIYGVINWKEVADENLTDELQLEVDQAMRSAPTQPQAAPVWADGPTSQPLEDANGIEDEALHTELSNFDLKPSDNNTAIALVSEGSNELVLDVQEPDEDASLADWLSVARMSASDAENSEQRSRTALYEAVGRAFDFSLVADENPTDYEEILNDAGLVVQDRAPMTPIVKLVFGAEYDKTRLTEYAAVLNFARRSGLERSSLPAFLRGYNGGLKAVVQAERDLRRPASKPVPESEDAVRARLRLAQPIDLADIAHDDEEFVLLVARRDEDGNLQLIGAVDSDKGMTDKALRNTIV